MLAMLYCCLCSVVSSQTDFNVCLNELTVHSLSWKKDALITGVTHVSTGPSGNSSCLALVITQTLNPPSLVLFCSSVYTWDCHLSVCPALSLCFFLSDCGIKVWTCIYKLHLCLNPAAYHTFDFHVWQLQVSRVRTDWGTHCCTSSVRLCTPDDPPGQTQQCVRKRRRKSQQQLTDGENRQTVPCLWRTARKV